MTFLLPYIEQQNLWNKWVSGGQGDASAYGVIVPTFICPSDLYPSGNGGFGYAQQINQLFGDYAGNFYVFGNPNGTSMQGNANWYSTTIEGNSRIPQSFGNGTSNTVMLSERWGSWCTGTTAEGAANESGGNAELWGDPNTPWRPSFCDVAPNGAGQSIPACTMFQVLPASAAACQLMVANSWHFGGLPVAMGDGSVHFLASSISLATWQNACNPNSGVPLGSDFTE
jgi:hypothetical protein